MTTPSTYLSPAEIRGRLRTLDFLSGITDGDFHLLEILARLPEPFDPTERWGTL